MKRDHCAPSLPLPSRCGGKYHLANRPGANPDPAETRGLYFSLTKPGKSKHPPEPKTSKVTNPQRVKKDSRTKPTQTKEKANSANQQEYGHLRQQRSDRREAQRKWAQENRQKAKQFGLCRDCRNEAIPGQTRCETCAESHRQARRRSDAERSARKKADRALNGQVGT